MTRYKNVKKSINEEYEKMFKRINKEPMHLNVLMKQREDPANAVLEQRFST